MGNVDFQEQNQIARNYFRICRPETLACDNTEQILERSHRRTAIFVMQVGSLLWPIGMGESKKC